MQRSSPLDALLDPEFFRKAACVLQAAVSLIRPCHPQSDLREPARQQTSGLHRHLRIVDLMESTQPAKGWLRFVARAGSKSAHLDRVRDILDVFAAASKTSL